MESAGQACEQQICGASPVHVLMSLFVFINLFPAYVPQYSLLLRLPLGEGCSWVW